MEQFFTYELFQKDRLVRIGKGQCARKMEDAVRSYLRRRYGNVKQGRFRYTWHVSEAAALKHETHLIDAYVAANSALPLWNKVRGGGGGQTYVKCASFKVSGDLCRNDALAGNYGFCGIHRR
jgi:hypothetical protein